MNKVVLCLLALWISGSTAHASVQSKPGNMMRDHASPYLRLHQNDPVAWQEWSRDVVVEAKKQNKLIFISIGYFACHWCHVMQRESFSDKIVADFMNREYLSVKVDRELNPALDAYLIEFVQRTRGHAGWPLNVVVTPDGYPVVGITYLPKTQFLSLLKQMNDLWLKDQNTVNETARLAAQQLREEKKLVKSSLDKKKGEQLAAEFLQQTLQYANDMQGGFGEQQKFPMVPQLQALISHYERKPQEPVKIFVQLTLDQMATQGMRDHIGGGFYRYTVDPDWQTPHFEKMLYDNASLAALYMRAGKVFNRPDYLGVARETLNFMVRDLPGKDGGLVASLSAVDDNNIEGGYYLWSKQELQTLLPEKEFEVISLLWKMEDAAAFEAGYLPRHANSPDEVAKLLGMSVSSVMELIASAHFTLFNARKNRQIPVDTKQLAAWNGLALSAFAQGIALDKTGKFRKVAAGIRNYLVNQLWDGKSLRRSKGGVGQEALEDYAFVAKGLYDWYAISGNKRDLQLAKRLVTLGWKRFYTESGWRMSDKFILPFDAGIAIIDDAPMPSPSSTLILLTQRMMKDGIKLPLKAKIDEALSVGHELIQQSPFSYPSQIEAIYAYLQN